MIKTAEFILELDEDAPEQCGSERVLCAAILERALRDIDPSINIDPPIRIAAYQWFRKYFDAPEKPLKKNEHLFSFRSINSILCLSAKQLGIIRNLYLIVEMSIHAEKYTKEERKKILGSILPGRPPKAARHRVMSPKMF